MSLGLERVSFDSGSIASHVVVVEGRWEQLQVGRRRRNVHAKNWLQVHLRALYIVPYKRGKSGHVPLERTVIIYHYFLVKWGLARALLLLTALSFSSRVYSSYLVAGSTVMSWIGLSF